MKLKLMQQRAQLDGAVIKEQLSNVFGFYQILQNNNMKTRWLSFISTITIQKSQTSDMYNLSVYKYA